MLVQPDAAAACFRIKRTQDVDIHARNLASWEQHYEQTSPGAFRGDQLGAGTAEGFECEVARVGEGLQHRLGQRHGEDGRV